MTEGNVLLLQFRNEMQFAISFRAQIHLQIQILFININEFNANYKNCDTEQSLRVHQHPKRPHQNDEMNETP